MTEPDATEPDATEPPALTYEEAAYWERLRRVEFPEDEEGNPTEPAAPHCIVCHRPAESWGVCPRCVERVDGWLADLPELVALAHLPEYLIPAWGPSPDAGPSTEHPIGVHTPALDLSRGEVLLSTDEDPETPGDPPWTGLEGWEQDWRHTLGLAAYGEASGMRLERSQSHENATGVTLVGVVQFLRAQWPTAAQQHPAADEFAADVRRMWKWAHAALRMEPADRDPSIEPAPDFTIACPADLPSGALCRNRLGIHRQPLEVPGHLSIPFATTCDRCGTHWTTARLLLVAQAAGVRIDMSRAEAEAFYGCSARTIQRMVERGTLTKTGGRYRPTPPQEDAG